MHSLLIRQLRKNLTKRLASHPEMEAFLKAIDMSYHDYDERLSMLYRATTMSSDELFEANKKLEKEAVQQKNILSSLDNAIRSLTENLNDKELFGLNVKDEFNTEYLAKYISNLADQVAEMTSEKDKLLKNLEAQNQSLNNYAQMVSHDLKSPIRNINALMSWIIDDEKDKFSDASKDNFSLLSLNIEKMDKLITGILKHATLGETEEHRVSFNLDTVLKEIERTIYVPENITFEHAGNLPEMVFEKDRLEQLFINLLTNAIKATEEVDKGIIRIDYEPDDMFWKFSVSDNGKGIADHHQNSIFEMFKKLTNDGNATGIGLAIVQKIVVLYEGDVWLESKENIGTTFYFTLKKKQ
ncbi:sensor histidine kinase [Maribacter sp. ACAM166]|uniref:sensor histidine kinase n=1 Tax=Maribacter sp. ACAM166 TaxID=2508996 RepID=UPI0010FE3DD7|nr:HAMP domain-containing sensor histidine kinase [Maribacter sp. ACAM166]TLP76788.1 HAMP domain-containing histidine kinase [Maribacter sp. ACAM166]